MKKLVTISTILGLVLAMLSVAAVAKTHRVEFLRDAVVSGVKLEAGKYKIKMDEGDEAQIFSGRNLLVKARVKVVPLGESLPNSVRQTADGTVSEIRFKKEKVVFVDSLPSGQTGE